MKTPSKPGSEYAKQYATVQRGNRNSQPPGKPGPGMTTSPRPKPRPEQGMTTSPRPKARPAQKSYPGNKTKPKNI